MTGKKIAVLLAAYQGEKHLREQLESLLCQTCGDFVCYIHDDGSSDGTEAIIAEYAEKHPERMVRVSGEPRGGAKANFRYLLETVEADVYLFCDQDDVWLKTKIADELEALEQTDLERPACVYTDLSIVDEQLREIDSSYYHYTGLDPFRNDFRQVMITSPCVGCTMMINRRLRDEMIRFQTENLPMHDWEAAVLAATLGEIRYLNRQTVFYRQHGENVCGATKKESGAKIVRRVLGDLSAYRERKRRNIERPRKLAGEMLTLEGLTQEQRQFLEAFTRIEEQGKSRRIRFYLENDLLRPGVNRAWQICSL